MKPASEALRAEVARDSGVSFGEALLAMWPGDLPLPSVELGPVDEE